MTTTMTRPSLADRCDAIVDLIDSVLDVPEAHEHTDLIVSGGIVRCGTCFTYLPNHPDSAPRPGLIAANQAR